MNDILKSSTSPTQEKTYKQKVKTISSTVIDDNDKEFPVAISYEYSNKSGWGSWGVIIHNVECMVSEEANISQSDLMLIAKDIIREEENGIVEFE